MMQKHRFNGFFCQSLQKRIINTGSLIKNSKDCFNNLFSLLNCLCLIYIHFQFFLK